MHPAGPADVPSLVEAYRHTLSSFADPADTVREQEWDRATCCPGWSARDHLAHVVHVEVKVPVAGWDSHGLEHITLSHSRDDALAFGTYNAVVHPA